MAAELVGGAAIGAVFGELLNAVLDVKDKVVMFKSVLKKMESTLNAIIPIFKDIEGLNRQLDRRKEETEPIMEVIKNGRNLVLECSRIQWYHWYRRPKYAKKLVNLEEKLKLYIQIVLLVQNARDIRELLVEKGACRVRTPLCVLPTAPIDPVGLRAEIEKLKMVVFKEEVSMVVISALPGCGKTTLATLFCHNEQVKERFRENIFYVKISNNASMEDIVTRLLNNDEVLFRDEDDVVYQLEQFLKKKESPILLVLDDVWADSESLLEKFKFRFADYKVLVTSRSELPGSGYTYKLQPLKDRDSMTLFRNAAGLQNSGFDIPQEIVSQVVKECKGSPLALKVVGKSLCRKPKEIWQTTMMELSESSSFLEYEELLKSLQRSLDTLDNKAELKQCFMDLCSFPEDQRIPVAALIDMWMELYKLNADEYAVSNLHELSFRYLVDLVIIRKDVYGCYNHQFVTQHDLLRELAVRHSNSEPIEKTKRVTLEIRANKVPDWWMEEKKQITARLLSISTDENFSSNWCIIEAPDVEVLVLNFWAKSYTLPKFMEKMEKLKVLIVTNYGFLPSQLSNFPVLATLSNLKRIRLEHVSIPAFGFTAVKLEKLQKITLVMCTDISRAFSFSTSNTNISDAFPNLAEINIDYSKDLVEVSQDFCNLVNVKKLCITSCPKLVALPEEINRLVSLEILILNSCIKLSELPNTIGGLHKLSALDISECCEIQALPEEIGNLDNLSVLDISECSEMGRLPETIGDLHNLKSLYCIGCSDMELPSSVLRLTNLKEVICDEGTATSWERYEPHLKDLRINVQKREDNLNWL